jgi:NAD(P)-dependent dehydrogenase (short-subunit alcohol dehydrogenase family)
MEDKICMVTGANAGIGKETALELARLGATVVLVSRSREKGEAARQDIIESTGNPRVELLLADLSSSASIRAMVEEFDAKFDRLDVLVNNAGVYLSEWQESVDGLEVTFATNHLGYFMTTLLLWDKLVAGAPARVVNVSSAAHRGAKLDFDDLQNEKNYQGFRVYSQSKLANILFTYELDRRRNGADVTINALHPGFIASGFGRNNKGIVGFVMNHIVPWFARSATDGAKTSIYLATSPAVAGHSGEYYADCKPVHSSSESHNQAAAARLWAESEALTQITTPAALAQS